MRFGGDDGARRARQLVREVWAPDRNVTVLPVGDVTLPSDGSAAARPSNPDQLGRAAQRQGLERKAERDTLPTNDISNRQSQRHFYRGLTTLMRAREPARCRTPRSSARWKSG